LKCKYEKDQNELVWDCLICKKPFKGEAKIYNPLEYKTIKMTVKKTICNGIRAYPEYVSCCNIPHNEIEKYTFHHKKTCNGILYKEYLNFLSAQKKRRKLELLYNGGTISNTVIPYALITDNFFLSGCAMKYISDSVSLKNCTDSEFFYKLLYRASLTLKKIHDDPRNIVIGDLHFDNILIDKKLDHYFIDMDSCMVYDIPADRLPNALKYYVINRGNFRFDVGKETDKLCMFLAMIGALFGTSIDFLDMTEYDIKAEQISTLRNMREFVLKIKNNKSGIPDIPYLSDLISVNDFLGSKKVKSYSKTIK
jgi:hypothetical protein